MPQQVEVTVIGAYFEEIVVRLTPLIDHFFNRVDLFSRRKPNRPLIFLPARIAVHRDPHP
jgi:hypothetical protein